MKRKPKAFRVHVSRLLSGPVYHINHGLLTENGNATVIEDGAPLPMAREVKALIRAAQTVVGDSSLEARVLGSVLGLQLALNALDRARKGKTT